MIAKEQNIMDNNNTTATKNLKQTEGTEYTTKQRKTDDIAQNRLQTSTPEPMTWDHNNAMTMMNSIP